MATINHTSLAVLSMLPIDAVPGSNAINHIMVTSEKKGSAYPEANVLLSPHLDVEGNKGVGMQWEQQGFDQQWLMFSVKRCNYPGRSRVSRLVNYI